MMRGVDTIDKVVNRHLCMGCGACAAARPDLVTMIDTETHGRRPLLRDNISKSENRALASICPGREIRFEPASDYDRAAWGPVLEVWEGHAVDPELRFRGSSGGVVSALALHGIESGAAAGVVQVRARKDEPLLNETVISRTRVDVLAATASRYSPASPCERLADVREDGRKHIFVGKPCDVAGADKLMRTDKRLRESIGLTVSIFCAGTPSQRATKQLIQALGVNDPARIDEIRYRGEGWPGQMKVRYRETAESAPKQSSMTYAKGWGEILQKHTQWRCRMCADHLGEHADLSVGDPWYRPVEPGEPGRSLVVARTERGRRMVREALVPRRGLHLWCVLSSSHLSRKVLHVLLLLDNDRSVVHDSAGISELACDRGRVAGTDREDSSNVHRKTIAADRCGQACSQSVICGSDRQSLRRIDCDCEC